ncbi:MAG: tetratricopeptide repeat protein [Vulcanimicrobiota bacterium]
MTRCFLRVVLLFVLLSNFGLAQSPFDKVVQSLLQQDDARAVRISETLVAENQGSFGLFYNQGLAYRNLGQPARARASFEQALQFEPRDLSTRRRLREVKVRLSPEITQHDVAATPWWSVAEAQTALLLAALLVLGLGLARASGRTISKRPLLVAGSGFVVLLALVAYTNPPASRGVLISPTVRLLEKPQGGDKGVVVPEGILVEVLGSKGHFVEVRTRESMRGWVRAAEIVLINGEGAQVQTNTELQQEKKQP